MSKLNWFQRLFTAEVEGQIIKKEFGYLSLARVPVTLYTLMQENKKLCRGALIGEHKSNSPNLGDKIEMNLEKSNYPLVQTTEERWNTIKNYRILESI